MKYHVILLIPVNKIIAYHYSTPDCLGKGIFPWKTLSVTEIKNITDKTNKINIS